MRDATLVVLARTPVPGAGKSRLRATFPAAAVDALALALVSDTLRWARDGHWGLLVAHHGPAGPLREIAGPDALLVEQPDHDDLGGRIAAAIDAAFSAGAGRAVLVGTDSPTLPGALLAAAFDGLDDGAATLIPALDGGWVALGVERPLGGCLHGVPWSVPTTLAHTLTALHRDGRATRLLPPWYDLDEPGDLDRLARQLRGPARRRAPATAQLLAGMPGIAVRTRRRAAA